MIFTLYLQFPKSKRKVKIPGSFAANEKDNVAYFFHERPEGRAETLLYPRIKHAGPGGIILDGMEPDGEEPSGRKKYKYQEWYLAYPKEPK